MRKICVINHKGGVGKTTTAVNLAAGLAINGRSVLIVDLDAQGNVNSCLEADNHNDIFNFLTEKISLQECICRLGKNLDILKSDKKLAEVEIYMTGEKGKEHFLKEKLETIKGYDYVIVDCPPSLNLFNRNALLYCDEAIIPVSTDPLGYEALEKMVAFIKNINDLYDHDIRITKIVPTLYDSRSNICKRMLKRMQDCYPTLTTDPIRTSTKLKEAPMAKKSIFSYDKKGSAAKDYENVVKLVMRDENLRIKAVEAVAVVE